MVKLSRNFMLFFTVFFSLIYMIWRIFWTIPFEYGTFSTICGMVLLVVEIIGFFEMVVHFGQLTNIRIPKKVEVDDLTKFPHVDIFISTYNEPPELLYKTINGCLHMDYPDKAKVHIYLCDDGHREEMGELCQKMGITHLVRDTHQFAKAGNLNHAMSVTDSPYIVTFDADMIPRRDFLMACMPYFLGEEEIGFLQTPQTFYNPDLFQYNLYSESRLPNEQDYFYRDVQVMRNASNTVIYGGTNTVLSRKALEDVGGFFTGVITEDFATGMKIQSKGYQCYAISESHASGMAPEDLKSLLKQRERWARGCIQTGRKVHLLFLKGLSLNQKISYLSSITYWYSSIKRFVYIMSPVLYAVFNVIVVKCSLLQVLLFWLPMYLFNNATLRMLSGNIRNTKITNVYETIMFPSQLPAVILESLGISQKKFVVTKKDGKAKAKGLDRGYKFKQALPLIMFLFLTVYGMCKSIYETFTMETPALFIIIFWLTVNSYNLLMGVFFMLGRKPNRKHERFDAVIDCLITFDDKLIKTKTNNISEGGISVILNFPEFIPPDQTIEIKLFNKDYSTTWYGKVANVICLGEKWKYGFVLTEISEEDKAEMFQMVYDREPTLPKEIESGYSSVDDIVVNIKNRATMEEYYSRKLPRVELSSWVRTLDHETAVIRDFNYEYLTLNFDMGQKIPEQLVLVERNRIAIYCELEKKNAKLGACYKIQNYDEITRNELFREVLYGWMYDYDKQTDKDSGYQKKVNQVLKENIVFDELYYL